MIYILLYTVGGTNIIKAVYQEGVKMKMKMMHCWSWRPRVAELLCGFVDRGKIKKEEEGKRERERGEWGIYSNLSDR